MSFCFILLFLLLFIVLILIYCKFTFNGPATPLTRDMTGQIVVITGADSHIGFETSKELLKKGAKVVFACRNKDKTIDQIKGLPSNLQENTVFIPLDLTSYSSILNFVSTLKEKIGTIDILINNAGTCFQNFSLIKGVEQTFFTNYLGHTILTSLLLKSFNPKGRIITVTTTKYRRIFQNQFEKFSSDKNLDFSYVKTLYDWMFAYVLTKLSDMLHMVYLSNLINDYNLDIKSVAVHPGFVKNDFFENIHGVYWTFRQFVMAPIRYCTFKEIPMGAQTHLHACYLKYEELTNGGYYKDCALQRLWSIAKAENAKKLMKFTKKLLEKNNIVEGNKEILDYFEKVK